MIKQNHSSLWPEGLKGGIGEPKGMQEPECASYSTGRSAFSGLVF